MFTSNKLIVRVITLILLLSPVLYAGQVVIFQGSTSGVNQEYGYSTIGSSAISRDNYRRIPFTPTYDVTITYGYFYGNDTGVSGNGTAGDGSQTMKLGIYNSGGTELGCSNTIDVSDSNTWNEMTFDPGVSLTASTTYYLCFHVPTLGFIDYHYDDLGGGAYGQSADCGTMYSIASDRINTMTVANYNAH